MNLIQRYYDILGLQSGASLAEIKQAYRELAKQWHPDRFPHDSPQQRQAEAKLKDINEAYHYLKDYEPEVKTAARQNRRRTERSDSHTTVSAKATNAEFWYGRGTENLQAGRYKQAIDDFSMAIRMNPNYKEAYRSRGFAHSMLGFELGAAADLQKAKQLELEQRVSAPPEPDRRNPFTPPAPAPQRSSPKPAASLELWQCIQTFSGHGDAITSLAVSRDGKFLVSGSRDRTLKFWNLRVGEVFSTLTKHATGVSAIALSLDGQLLASGGENGAILLWDLKQGSLLRSLAGHTDAINALAFSSDKRVLVSGGEDGTVRFWNVATSKPAIVHRHQVSTKAVAVSPDGSLAISGGNNSILTLYQVKTGELLRTTTGHFTGISSIAISSTGQFATGGQDSDILLWADSAIVTGNPQQRIATEMDTVRSLGFNPDGSILASGGDRTIQLWNANGEFRSTLTGHTDAVLSLTFSADGQTLFSSSGDRAIKLWRRQG